MAYNIDMEEACRKIKGNRCLKDAIVQYYANLSNRDDLTWDVVSQTYNIGEI